MNKVKFDKFNGMDEQELQHGIKVDIQLDIDKLNRIYDLEEELGIPLEVLFKAMKDGIEILETTKKVRVSIRYDDYFKKWVMKTADYHEYDIDLEKYGEEWY